jgi:N-acyl-D-amino-acid deacylase
MTLLIKNVQLIDGSGVPAVKRDIFVSGNTISAVGSLPGKKAEGVIDGQGGYAVPGFIDVHHVSDHYLTLFTYPLQRGFLAQGVTTVIAGQDGASLAPLLDGSLATFQTWTNPAHANVDWHSLKELFKKLDAARLGVNFATLIGYTTVRRTFAHNASRSLTGAQLDSLCEAFRRALREGGCGISFGREYLHGKQVSHAELKRLAHIVKEHEGVCAFALDAYETPQGVVEAAVHIAQETGVKAMVCGLMPHAEKQAEYQQALEALTNVPEETGVYADIRPLGNRLRELYTFLPQWAKRGGLDAMAGSLEDEWFRNKIIKELPPVDPSNFVVAHTPGQEFLVGNSLGDIKKHFELKSVPEALMQLMRLTKLQAVISCRDASELVTAEALAKKRILVGSHAADFPQELQTAMLADEVAPHAFTNALKMLQAHASITLEAAVRRLTAVPAEVFGIAKRGIAAPGCFADIVVLDAHLEVKHVIVNGTIAIKNGVCTNMRAGKVLRRT